MGMTKTRRNQYSKQFKAEAVELVLLTGRPNVEVAAELGINAGTLGNWVNQWKRENPEAEPEMTPRDMARLEAVEEELRAVKLENEFLKKPPWVQIVKATLGVWWASWCWTSRGVW